MTEVVVVGPVAVIGPGVVDPVLASVALDCVDDRLAVYADGIVSVRSLWTRLVRELRVEGAEPAVLVVPTAWPAARVEFVEEMLRTACSEVTVLRRAEALMGDADAVVEIGPDGVTVRHRDGEESVVSRSEGDGLVSDAVLAALRDTASVLIDAPDGVAGATALSTVVARGLRRDGADVSVLDDVRVPSAVAANRVEPPPRGMRLPRVDRTRIVAVTGAAAAVALLAGAAATSGHDAADDADSTWIVEGRVSVLLPTSWPVRRITSGPGSARVQANSPDGSSAIHVTAARVSDAESLAATAETLRNALDRQPRDVFADFTGDGRAADRPAVTYTESRSGSVVEWAVVLDRGVRIAVGCQHPGSRRGAGPECDHAIRSAQAAP